MLVYRHNYYMNFLDLLLKKKMTQYRLSVVSGVPRTTIVDICAGRTLIKNANGETLYKLAKALKVPMEALIELDQPDQIDEKTKMPRDESYLEIALPKKIKQALNGYKRAFANDNLAAIEYYLSILTSEIKSSLIKQEITRKQRDYLFKKYLNQLED